MQKTVKIQYRKKGRFYTAISGAFVLKKGDKVIIQKHDGNLDFATVVFPPKFDERAKINKKISKIFRIATEKDIKQKEHNIEKEKKAFKLCTEQKDKLGLNMKLFAVESTFNASKFIFFFTADERVDFRELIKFLIAELKTKIEMRQVGIRNFVKLYGGIGICGRETCCSSFLKKFSSISLRMAKNQNLLLNPAKISGICDRLLCCLDFEDKTYTTIKKKMPKLGKYVETTEGKGRIISQLAISNKVEVALNRKEEQEEKNIRRNIIVKVEDLLKR